MKDDIEKCPSCFGVSFAVARNMIGTRVCSCGYSWVPSHSYAKKTEILKKERDELKEKLNIALDALIKMRGYGYEGDFPCAEALTKIEAIGKRDE